MTREDEEKESLDIVKLRRDMARIHSHPTIFKDVNFLNHIGYFCHDDHRAATISAPMVFSDRITLEGAPFQLDYTVTPDPRYGYPSTIAYKIWDWIDSALTFYGRPARNPIFFDMATLRLVCGLAKSGTNDKIIRKAINQLRHTDISTKCYRLGKNQWVKLTYRLIDTVLEFGENNEAKGGFISISQNILTSYNNQLSFTLSKGHYMKALETSSARALYALFYRAFTAAQKAGQEKPVLIKDYRSLCAQLGFRPRPYKSQIKQQLVRHMEVLSSKKIGLLASWEILPNSNNNGFNIKLVAAQGFEKVIAADKFQQSIPFLPPPPQNISEPAELRAAEAVVYFLEKRFGLNQDEGFINNKDISNMKQFIDILPGGTNPKEFIDHCLSAAADQKLELASVGGMKIFVNSFLSQKITSQKRKAILKESDKKQEIKDKATSLQTEFLMSVWDEFATHNKEQAEEREREFHNELMRDRVVKDSFDSKGADSVLYSKMIDNSKRQFAKSITNKESWRCFLKNNDVAVETFIDFFPNETQE